MIPQNIGFVAQALTSAASKECTPKGFKVGFHLHLLPHFSVIVISRCAGKLTRRLCPKGKYQLFCGIGTEINVLVIEPKVGCNETVIVIKMVLKPFGIGITIETVFASYLYPPFCVRNILEVYKTEAGANRGAGIAAHDQVSTT